MASDFALVTQLYAFMDAIPILWAWQDLRESYRDGQTFTEQRGPDGHFLQFEFQVLEEGTKDGGQYLHILVAVTDPTRSNEQRGGSKTPLSTSFLYFENGEVDAPLAREIYERPY
ncbi:hypothetical protein JM946_02365 [Steroidobacter sp. S1-65]|uniref:Uncharacterized protein n=1 Tax=Steroidobacter gossypii TaxID=2805490 RepID=A0ABS1WRG1_9GAMM|nr:hypothetical protein [Steroidobacter gossypii]MBM0103564.1 hypothetical protein [Steroidobacter gossypii]